MTDITTYHQSLYSHHRTQPPSDNGLDQGNSPQPVNEVGEWEDSDDEDWIRDEPPAARTRPNKGWQLMKPRPDQPFRGQFARPDEVPE